MRSMAIQGKVRQRGGLLPSRRPLWSGKHDLDAYELAQPPFGDDDGVHYEESSFRQE